MSRFSILWTIMTVALAASAHAATTPPGVNLRWDSCYADGGVINKTFACDTNTGSERLVMSFVLDADMLDVSGQEIRVFIKSVNPTLPSWWALKNAGTCRVTSLGFLDDAPARRDELPGLVGRSRSRVASGTTSSANSGRTRR
jgi:hypothetical protein